MRYHWRWSWVVTVLLLGGCADSTRVALMTVLNHGNCQTVTTGVQLIDYGTVAQLRGTRLIGMSNEAGDGAPPLHLIAILPGEYPTSGYSIHLNETAPKLSDPLTIRITLQPPPQDAMQAQVMTRPCLVVGIDDPAVKIVRVIDDRDALLGEVDLRDAASGPPARESP